MKSIYIYVNHMKMNHRFLSILFFFLFSGTNANSARRLRRQALLNAGQQPGNPNSQMNAFSSQADARQQPLGPNPQILNAQGQQQLNPGGMGLPKDANLGQNQGGRQYMPYQGQMGYGYNNPGMGYQYQNQNPYMGGSCK